MVGEFQIFAVITVFVGCGGYQLIRFCKSVGFIARKLLFLIIGGGGNVEVEARGVATLACWFPVSPAIVDGMREVVGVVIDERVKLLSLANLLGCSGDRPLLAAYCCCLSKCLRVLGPGFSLIVGLCRRRLPWSVAVGLASSSGSSEVFCSNVLLDRSSGIGFQWPRYMSLR